MTPRLKERYKKEIIQNLMTKLIIKILMRFQK